MLAELKFVQGSVAKKDFVPALTHFVIEKGTVRGYNGLMALCAPIPFDIECKPKADPLIRAIGNCDDTIALSMTTSGKLSIKSGKFRALIECIEGDTPHAMPEGEPLALAGEPFLEAMKTLLPLVGDDASRPWANGILLRGCTATATNNIILAEYWVGAAVPRPINIPRAAVREIVRIGEPPINAQLTPTSLSLHYSGGRWLRCQLFSSEWPDFDSLLNKPSAPLPIEPEIFEATAKVKHFADKMGRLYFHPDGTVSTQRDKLEGAAYEVAGIKHEGLYNIEMLDLLNGIATTMDWSTYPKPCLFFGDRLRGAIIGMREQ